MCPVDILEHPRIETCLDLLRPRIPAGGPRELNESDPILQGCAIPHMVQSSKAKRLASFDLFILLFLHHFLPDRS